AGASPGRAENVPTFLGGAELFSRAHRTYVRPSPAAFMPFATTRSFRCWGRYATCPWTALSAAVEARGIQTVRGSAAALASSRTSSSAPRLPSWFHRLTAASSTNTAAMAAGTSHASRGEGARGEGARG